MVNEFNFNLVEALEGTVYWYSVELSECVREMKKLTDPKELESYKEENFYGLLQNGNQMREALETAKEIEALEEYKKHFDSFQKALENCLYKGQLKEFEKEAHALSIFIDGYYLDNTGMALGWSTFFREELNAVRRIV
ncbi:hypothetical protein ACLM5H_24615 [Fredinandcohnia humi]